jgi:LuxR family transcriptional regulator, maltose regulon positive regulatory protein
MFEPLLTTKLFRPLPPQNLVPRPVLLETLDSGFSGKLVLISAAAGYGKTTLLSSWLTARSGSRRVAWLSLDEGDSDPTRFVSYMVAALNTIDGFSSDPNGLPMQASTAMMKEGILTAILNDIAAASDEIILILEDYHATESQDVDDIVEFFLEYMPSNMHIGISTRSDPALPLARLRGEGALTEVRTADLRFQKTDVVYFLNHMMGLELSASDISILEHRTDGWIVGLKLAAISLRQAGDASAFIRNFSGRHQHILDYLVDEVLLCQSESTQKFLSQTSILERLCGSLCDAVCSFEKENGVRTDGQETLERLAGSNLFIVPLDDERKWFRYHHLFADLLRSRLIRHDRDMLPTLHARAADWFEQNGFTAEAIAHVIQNEDYERAAVLIEQGARQTMLHGRITTILQWIQAIPGTILATRPRLSFYHAWALSISGDPDGAEKKLLKTRAALEELSDTPDNRSLRGELAALLTGIVTSHNDPARVIHEAEIALTYLDRADLVSRARVGLSLGIAHAYQNELPLAKESFEQTRDLALGAENPFLAAAAVELLADIWINHEGHLEQASRNLQRVLDSGSSPDGTFLPLTGFAHCMLAEIHLERNDVDAASRYLERATNLIRQSGIRYSLTHLHCARARFELACGETGRVADELRSAEEIAVNSPLIQFRIHNLACQVKFALYLGDTDAAMQWIQGDRIPLPGNLPFHLEEIRRIACARVYHAQGHMVKALEELDRILPAAESSAMTSHVIECNLLKSMVLQQRSDFSTAHTCLLRAVKLASTEGYLRSFLELGEPMARLLVEATGHGTEAPYVSRLLAAFPATGNTGLSNADKADRIIEELPEPLSNREIEVLRLMEDGLTYGEIGNRIFVSVNTVRTHVMHLYGKLGVHNRSAAISKARSLGVL